jgi:hypothetical protein
MTHGETILQEHAELLLPNLLPQVLLVVCGKEEVLRLEVELLQEVQELHVAEELHDEDVEEHQVQALTQP